MPGDTLSVLTLITNFLCMAISLWFAIYLLARSLANQLTSRAVIGLLALSFYYNNAFTDLLIGNQNIHPVRSLGVLVALIASHDLTHNMLPDRYHKKLEWLARFMVLLSIVAIIFLFLAAPKSSCDTRYTCPANISYPWSIVDLIELIVFASLALNLWLINKTKTWFNSFAFYAALLCGISTIVLGVIGTLLNINIPRLIPNIFMLACLAFLLYSVAHDQTLVTSRNTDYELPITLLTIIIIIVAYTFFAWQMELSPASILLLVVLAILTHSAYDLVREFLDGLFVKQEHRVREELRQLSKENSERRDLQRFTSDGLAILCRNLNAASGLIAFPRQDGYEITSSLHSLPVGTRFSQKDIYQEGDVQPAGLLKGYLVHLAPACVKQEEAIVVSLLAREGSLFSQEDCYWTEDIAEEIGLTLFTQINREAGVDSLASQTAEKVIAVRTSNILSTLAIKPDADMVECVEDAFRNLNDYSYLGKSPLVGWLGIEARDHLEAGKQVQQKLNGILDKLRPIGKAPSEPLPHEWHAYTILHDAYVEEKLAREIMARLYISEGTYYRMRRHALRGVTRALIEVGKLPLTP